MDRLRVNSCCFYFDLKYGTFLLLFAGGAGYIRALFFDIPSFGIFVSGQYLCDIFNVKIQYYTLKRKKKFSFRKCSIFGHNLRIVMGNIIMHCNAIA